MARARWQVESSILRHRAGAYPHAADPGGRPPLLVQALGAVSIMVGADRLDPSSDTIFALLLRTVYSPGMQVARELLQRGIWPGQPEKRQSANLRQALYKLRRLGVSVGLTGDVVNMDSTQVVPTFALLRTTERFEEDVTRGHEPFGLFLPGYATGNAEYDEWLGAQRDAVHADVRRVLVERLRARRERADWMGADALARWLLQFDPLNEEATLTFAECAALNGSKAEALAILDRYLAELGADAGDIRLPATLLKRRIAEPQGKQRVSFAPTERHFVGREELMAELTLAMRRAKWHDGSATLLHGPPGMGKTRVTQELAKVAAIEGFRVISVSCRESDQHRPLSVFLDLVPELLEMPGAMGCSPESMRVLRRLVGCGRESGNLPLDAAPMEPLPPASALRTSIVDLVAAVSDERVSLAIFDDTQWLDSESWEVLADLAAASRRQRIFLLMLSRDSLDYRMQGAIASDAIEVRELRALTDDARVQLVERLCEDLSLPLNESTIEWFADSSEGIPMFLRALVDHWAVTGSAGGVPPTLAKVLSRRIAEMSPDALRVVQVASLLGKAATLNSIQRVLEVPTARLVDAIESLNSIAAVRRRDSAVLAVHDLLARAALEALSDASKRLLHLRISDGLRERLAAEPYDGLREDAIEHLLQSGEQATLHLFAVECVEHYLSVDLPHRALAICERVIVPLRDSRRALVLEELLVDCYYRAGKHARVLAKDLAAPDRSGASRRWDVLNPDHALRFIDAASYSNASEDFDDLCARAQIIAAAPSVDLSLRVRAACAAIRLASNTSNAEAAQRAFHLALELAQSLPNDTEATDEILMYYHTSFGCMEKARASAVRLASRFSNDCEGSKRALGLSQVGFALRATGELDLAWETFSLAYNKGMKLELPTVAGFASWRLALMSHDVHDDLVESKYWIDRCSAVPGIREEHLLSEVIGHHQARLAIAAGSIELARPLVEACASSKHRTPHQNRRAYSLAIDIAFATLTRDMSVLTTLADRALQRFRDSEYLLGQDYLASQTVTALTLLGRSEEACDFVANYRTSGRRELSPIPRYLDRAIATALSQ